MPFAAANYLKQLREWEFKGDGPAKDEFCTDMFGLLSPKTTLNLCYKCKLQERFCLWGHSSLTATVVFQVIGTFSSHVFFLSLTTLMKPYILKITWSLSKMPCPRRICFLLGSDNPCECGDKILLLSYSSGCKGQRRLLTFQRCCCLHINYCAHFNW